MRNQCHIQQFFGGASFSTSVARRKTVVQLGSLGWCCKPSPVGSKGETLEIFGYFAFWIAQNMALKSTLLSVWGFEFGIPNRYTGFKIALDTALALSVFIKEIRYKIWVKDRYSNNPIGLSFLYNHLNPGKMLPLQIRKEEWQRCQGCSIWVGGLRDFQPPPHPRKLPTEECFKLICIPSMLKWHRKNKNTMEQSVLRKWSLYFF